MTRKACANTARVDPCVLASSRVTPDNITHLYFNGRSARLCSDVLIGAVANSNGDEQRNTLEIKRITSEMFM